MTVLANLSNTSRRTQSRKRVGRGPGSGIGKTSGRGHKGAGARSGYKRRFGYEGGQMRLFRHLPRRGFSNVQFRRDVVAVNLIDLERHFKDGESVTRETLEQFGVIKSGCGLVKLLANGKLTKKLAKVEVDLISAGAKSALEEAGISYTVRG